MAYSLSDRSLERLSGIHPDLQRIVERAIEITDVDFAVLEGRRSEERQRELVESGASQTMRSRHLTGHAVDLGAYVNGEVRWDWPLYDRIALAMYRAADELGIKITWGGTWKSLRDGPHFQLAWDAYPV